ncbi:MAG: hypothetical protein IKN74_01340 [Clostridia bacterium]|nr:hypothetical protein [Clostridia bacterium]
MEKRNNSNYSDVDVSIVNIFFQINDLDEEYKRIVSASEVIAMKKTWYDFISHVSKSFVANVAKGNREYSKAIELYQSTYNFEAFNNLVDVLLRALFFKAVNEVLSIPKEDLKKEINFKIMLHEFLVMELLDPSIKHAGLTLHFQFVDSIIKNKWVDETLAEILVELNKKALNNNLNEFFDN